MYPFNAAKSIFNTNTATTVARVSHGTHLFVYIAHSFCWMARHWVYFSTASWKQPFFTRSLPSCLSKVKRASRLLAVDKKLNLVQIISSRLDKINSILCKFDLLLLEFAGIIREYRCTVCYKWVSIMQSFLC